MSYGWMKKLLHIDLTSGKIEVKRLEDEVLRKYLGGRGLNMKALHELTDRQTDPLGPGNPLIFGTGPITGTLAPVNGRFNVTTKSPLTGALGDANSGGFWASELKYAGYDQLIVTGRSGRPVYISIADDKVEIRDAEKLWGRNVWEADRALLEMHGDDRIQIAAIGQAGENRVPMAGIMNNLSRAAARTGVGAVMGSKTLKAIVVRGTGGVRVADPQRFDHSARRMTQTIYSAPSYQIRSTLGTTMLVTLYNRLGALPTRNCQRSWYDKAEKISGETLLDRHVVKTKACFACPVHCSRFYRVENGPYAGTEGEGPEYETLSALGSRCDNDNLESILHINTLCNQYGLDTISAGGAIAFAMECWEKGLIGKKDTDGLDLSWGNHEVIVSLIHRIARKEGFGGLLAQGVKKASEAIPGSARFAIHVKGLEPPAQGVRGLKAWGLAWAVASRGADHLRAFPLPENIWREEDGIRFFGTKDAVNRFEYNGKAKLVKWCEEFSAITDCLEMCKIPAMAMMIPVENMADLLSAATGVEFTAEELMAVGERVVNLERVYNGKLGFDRKDDRLPDRMREEPVPEGASKGEVVDETRMLDEYYSLRGWDERGLPTPEKLAALGLMSEECTRVPS